MMMSINFDIIFVINIVTPYLLNFFSISLFGSFIGRKGSILLTLFCNILILISIFIILLNQLKHPNKITILYLYKWISILTFDTSLVFVLDSLSITMAFLIVSVSNVVHLYSIDYMKNDPHLQRFLSYLSLFTFFMLLLIMSNNLIQLFFGWEGVGICSYLLISFWYLRLDACKSAIKAVIYNKIGDCSLLASISIIFFFWKTTNFSIIFSLIEILSINLKNNLYFIDLISFFIIVASIGKSAQFFLHLWLADAMEGPTPVSALIHAATMVTAGIFLIIRCSFLISYSTYNLFFFMAYVGALTIFFSSTVGIFQNDLKKIIAYSTCSQLGYMFVSCSFLNFKVAFFHLINHGFFKALLFLSAGLLIHNFLDEQDIRKFGGLFFILPISYSFSLLGSISLIGFPFLTGFYSKDLIIEYLFLSSYLNSTALFCFYLTRFSIFLTGLYSIRLLYYIFWIKPSGYKKYYTSIQNKFETNKIVLISLIILAVLSLTIGYILQDLFIGLGSNFFDSTIYNYNIQGEANLKKYNEFLIKFPMKIIPFYYIVLSILTFFFFVYLNFQISFLIMNMKRMYLVYVFLNQAWFVNFFVSKSLIKNFFICNNFFFFDKLFLDNIGPNWIKFLVNKSSIILFMFDKQKDLFSYIRILYVYVIFLLVYIFIYINNIFCYF